MNAGQSQTPQTTNDAKNQHAVRQIEPFARRYALTIESLKRFRLPPGQSLLSTLGSLLGDRHEVKSIQRDREAAEREQLKATQEEELRRRAEQRAEKIVKVASGEVADEHASRGMQIQGRAAAAAATISLATVGAAPGSQSAAALGITPTTAREVTTFPETASFHEALRELTLNRDTALRQFNGATGETRGNIIRTELAMASRPLRDDLIRMHGVFVARAIAASLHAAEKLDRDLDQITRSINRGDLTVSQMHDLSEGAARRLTQVYEESLRALRREFAARVRVEHLKLARDLKAGPFNKQWRWELEKATFAGAIEAAERYPRTFERPSGHAARAIYNRLAQNWESLNPNSPEGRALRAELARMRLLERRCVDSENGKFTGQLREVAEKSVEFAQKAGQAAKDLGGKVGEKFREGAGRAGSAIKEGAAKAGSIAKEGAKKAGSIAREGASQAGKAARSVGSKAGAMAKGAGGALAVEAAIKCTDKALSGAAGDKAPDHSTEGYIEKRVKCASEAVCYEAGRSIKGDSKTKGSFVERVKNTFDNCVDGETPSRHKSDGDGKGAKSSSPRGGGTKDVSQGSGAKEPGKGGGKSGSSIRESSPKGGGASSKSGVSRDLSSKAESKTREGSRSSEKGARDQSKERSSKDSAGKDRGGRDKSRDAGGRDRGTKDSSARGNPRSMRSGTV